MCLVVLCVSLFNGLFLGGVFFVVLLNSNWISNSVLVLGNYFFMSVYLFYWLVVLLCVVLSCFILVWFCVDYCVFVIHVTGINLSILLIIVFVSNVVLMNAIDYLGIIESVLFLVSICVFQFSMIMFVWSGDLLISFINWDLLGIISYLLINYWIGKVNSGINAIVFNKVGDVGFMVGIVFLYDFVCVFLLEGLNCFFVCVVYNGVLLCCWLCFVVCFSKSAQLPFCSWLLNAMSAPTPISALLHSSTMVIVGVYLGLIIDDQLLLLVDFCGVFCVFFVVSVVLTLLWSSWNAVSVSDVNSIIAFSTISQISYMFLALLVSPILSLFIY